MKELKNDFINIYPRELTNENSRDYSLWKATERIEIPMIQILRL